MRGPAQNLGTVVVPKFRNGEDLVWNKNITLTTRRTN